MNVELYLKEMGQRIMERRKKLELTQEALAELSELTTQFVSYAESGKRGMRDEAREPDESGCCIGSKHRLSPDRGYH